MPRVADSPGLFKGTAGGACEVGAREQQLHLSGISSPLPPSPPPPVHTPLSAGPWQRSCRKGAPGEPARARASPRIAHGTRHISSSERRQASKGSDLANRERRQERERAPSLRREGLRTATPATPRSERCGSRATQPGAAARVSEAEEAAGSGRRPRGPDVDAAVHRDERRHGDVERDGVVQRHPPRKRARGSSAAPSAASALWDPRLPCLASFTT